MAIFLKFPKIYCKRYLNRSKEGWFLQKKEIYIYIYFSPLYMRMWSVIESIEKYGQKERDLGAA